MGTDLQEERGAFAGLGFVGRDIDAAVWMEAVDNGRSSASAHTQTLVADGHAPSGPPLSAVRTLQMQGHQAQRGVGRNTQRFSRWAAHAAAIGLVNLICNLARYEQIVRLKLLPRPAA